ncbi:MAG: hypothetical protein HS113_21350 [Verrucomicrobiales bacterium]|nr:hypothetical protein [Verrucomicrobiales bacterium]
MLITLRVRCLAALVGINGLFVVSIAYVWLVAYQPVYQDHNPLLTTQTLETRATLNLCVAAITVPVTFALYARTARHLKPLGRVATLELVPAEGEARGY